MERSWAGVGQELGKSWTGVWHAILGQPRAADGSAHSAGPVYGIFGLWDCLLQDVSLHSMSFDSLVRLGGSLGDHFGIILRLGGPLGDHFGTILRLGGSFGDHFGVIFRFGGALGDHFGIVLSPGGSLGIHFGIFERPG